MHNRLDRQFGVATVPAVNHAWAADITYVPTGEGWLYLAVVLDLKSRRVVGWALRPRLDQQLTLAALQMALTHRGRPACCITPIAVPSTGATRTRRYWRPSGPPRA